MSVENDWLPAPIGVEVHGGDGSSDVSLVLSESDVTIAEIFEALDLPDTTLVDGQLIACPADVRAVEVLMSGSLLDADGVTGGSKIAIEDPRSLIEVAVVGGLDAGAVAQLDAGLFQLRAVDAAAHDGWVLHIDHHELAAVEAAPWHVHGSAIEAVAGDGFVMALGRPIDPEPRLSRTLHRPPRALPPAAVQAVAIESPPAAVREPSPLSWATLLAPIPIALMMAFFFRPIFALFAAMGPIMALGRWYESRRRFRRETRERSIAIAAQIAAVGVAVSNQRDELMRLRWLRNPHVGELWRRARSNSVRLWERRPNTPGYLEFSIAIGPDSVSPVTSHDSLDREVHAELLEPLELGEVPHTIDLSAHTGVGVHGQRHDALAVARSIILQLATLHGPADLKIGVLCSEFASDDWDWVKWLPHCDRGLTGYSAQSIAKTIAAASSGQHDANRSGRTTRSAGVDATTVRVIIVDDPGADVASLSRAAQEGDLRIVAIAPDAVSLPAACSALVAVEHAAIELYSPQSGRCHRTGAAIGISLVTTTGWARALSRFSDPEVADLGHAQAQAVRLLQLVGCSTPDEIESRWAECSPDDSPVALVGASAEGPFAIDLTTDGPHILIAGTTGSGKSELLRTLVASLAVACPPEHLNFVLIDFKGGGAFDAVDGLPHVAGVITDLDEAMVTRAVNSLRSELMRREVLFRDLGVSAYTEAARRADEPLARLVIVIDEFAALATDYPELMAAIVDLAARGRSLGMHLVLATQRPNGIVDQKIRANTNLRIALRVQDPYDSQDVVGVGDAALIDRRTPGRAFFRVAGEVPVLVQTAYSGNADARATRCLVHAHTLFDHTSTESVAIAEAGADTPTELQVLVEAIGAASAVRQFSARSLWPEPLPLTLDWIDLGSREIAVESDGAGDVAHGVALGLADIPEQQRQAPWHWDLDSGPLVIYGASASCAGKVLLAVGAAVASASNADEAHLYVIDGGSGGVAQLGDIAHTGAYMTLDECDRIDRCIRLLEQTLARRRSDRYESDGPRLVLLVDNLAAVLAAHDEMQAGALIDRLSALARDGSSQRVHLVVTARTIRDVSYRFAQQIPNRLVMALADPSGFLSLGIKARDVVPLPEMRAIDVVTHRQVQLVEPPRLESWADQPDVAGAGAAVPVRGLESTVGVAELSAVSLDAGVVTIPIGIDAHELASASLVLRPGEHVLIVAPNGAGRTTALATIAHQVHRSGAGLSLVRVATAHPPPSDDGGPGTVLVTADEIASFDVGTEPTLVLVDDAHRVKPDVAAVLEQLLEIENVFVIAATTPDAARSMRAWTASIRTSGVGLVLGGTTGDGDIFRARFDRLAGLGTVPGRGHLVQRGRVTPLQVATTNAPTENL